MTDYLSKTTTELHELLVAKVIKPVDLVTEALAKIEASDCNAFITINKEALKEAQKLEDLPIDNPLFGMPIVIKDNICTKQLRTTCASHMLDHFKPIYDATVINKIKAAHMIIIGKTNMDEFAMGSTGETSYFGVTKNPWNHNKIPGGSSSGTAAALASRIAPLGLGSDTGGSIRQPASFCGLVGLKPTYGRVSRYGLIAFASSLDQIGPMTTNVKDNALLLNVISGHDDNDQTSSALEEHQFESLMGKDIKGLKIAVPHYYMSEAINPEVKTKITMVIALLKKEGCLVDEIDIPYLEYAIPLYQTIALGEASSNLARFDGIKYGHATAHFDNIDDLYMNSRSEGFGREVKRRIMIGSYVLSGENANLYYRKALMLRSQMSEALMTVFDSYDLIIGPTNTNVAYDLGTKTDDALKSFYDDLLTIPVNMAGLPAMSLPVGFNHEHLPIGMHIIAKPFNEKVIYQLASLIETKLQLNNNPKEVK